MTCVACREKPVKNQKRQLCCACYQRVRREAVERGEVFFVAKGPKPRTPQSQRTKTRDAIARRKAEAQERRDQKTAERLARGNRLLSLYRTGNYTIEALAHVEGITRQRVHQLLKIVGGSIADKPRRVRKRLTHEDRLARNRANTWKRIVKGEPNECWLWTGSKINNRGKRYPHIVYPTCHGYDPPSAEKQRRTSPYRIVYQEVFGPIPQGLTVDHICFNPLCCNPAHLQLLTRSQNSARKRPETWAKMRDGVIRANTKISGKGTRDSSQSPVSSTACVLAHASSEKHTASPRPTPGGVQ